eukprot:tig00021314_g20117.t1
MARRGGVKYLALLVAVLAIIVKVYADGVWTEVLRPNTAYLMERRQNCKCWLRYELDLSRYTVRGPVDILVLSDSQYTALRNSPTRFPTEGYMTRVSRINQQRDIAVSDWTDDGVPNINIVLVNRNQNFEVLLRFIWDFSTETQRWVSIVIGVVVSVGVVIALISVCIYVRHRRRRMGMSQTVVVSGGAYPAPGTAMGVPMGQPIDQSGGAYQAAPYAAAPVGGYPGAYPAAPAGGYGYPPAQYGAPPPQYGAPYGAPPPQYGAPPGQQPPGYPPPAPTGQYGQPPGYPPPVQ